MFSGVQVMSGTKMTISGVIVIEKPAKQHALRTQWFGPPLCDFFPIVFGKSSVESGKNSVGRRHIVLQR